MIRAALPPSTPTDTEPEPEVTSRSVAPLRLMSPEPVVSRHRPSGAVAVTSADPVRAVSAVPAGTPIRMCAVWVRNTWSGNQIRRVSAS